MVTDFLQGLFTGKLAWVKVVLGVIATLLVSLSDIAPLLGVDSKLSVYLGIAVGIGTWLTAHGFHKAEAPAKPLGS